MTAGYRDFRSVDFCPPLRDEKRAAVHSLPIAWVDSSNSAARSPSHREEGVGVGKRCLSQRQRQAGCVLAIGLGVAAPCIGKVLFPPGAASSARSWDCRAARRKPQRNCTDIARPKRLCSVRRGSGAPAPGTSHTNCLKLQRIVVRRGCTITDTVTVGVLGSR